MNKFIQKIKEDFSFYAERFLKIENKAGKVIPFKLNNAQRKVDKIISDFRRNNPNKPIRTLNLKARQEGISTYYSGRGFWKVSTKFNKHCKIVGHVGTASNNLFTMTKRYYDHLPQELKPVLKASNAQELSYSKLQSDIKILTAETGDIGRSSTNQYLHLTELAFWRDAKTTLTALMQTVPDDNETEIHIETTANGLGGTFYELWQDAKNGKNDFIPIFLAWWEHEEYTKPIESFETFVLTAEELNLKKAYNLTNEQLNWRRWAIKNKCGGDTDVFKQEYPANDIEAFLTSGRPVFNVEVCQSNYLECDNRQYQQGNLVYNSKGILEFEENKNGYIKLYRQIDLNPNDIYRFAIGCDVAEGLEQGDYSYMPILDRHKKDIPMVWHGHIDPDLLADEQYKIQQWLLGQCYFCTEFNNHGIAVVNSAYRLGVKQYYQQDFTKGVEMQKDTLGFKTTSSTKPEMIKHLTSAIREDDFKSYELEFWDECLTYVKDEKGRMGAQGKNKNPGVRCYDDRVMGTGLMWICHLWMPLYQTIDNKIYNPARSFVRKDNSNSYTKI